MLDENVNVSDNFTFQIVGSILTNLLMVVKVIITMPIKVLVHQVIFGAVQRVVSGTDRE